MKNILVLRKVGYFFQALGLLGCSIGGLLTGFSLLNTEETVGLLEWISSGASVFGLACIALFGFAILPLGTFVVITSFVQENDEKIKMYYSKSGNV